MGTHGLHTQVYKHMHVAICLITYYFICIYIYIFMRVLLLVLAFPCIYICTTCQDMCTYCKGGRGLDIGIDILVSIRVHICMYN